MYIALCGEVFGIHLLLYLLCDKEKAMVYGKEIFKGILKKKLFQHYKIEWIFLQKKGVSMQMFILFITLNAIARIHLPGYKDWV